MPNTRLKRYNGNSWEEVEVQTDWGQVLNKPTTFTPTSHTHGNILNTGSITSATITPADQDRILVADASNSGKIERGIIIGTGTTTFLRNDGTWATPSGVDTNNYLTGVSGSGNGTITFTRQGLTNLTFNAAHTHAISDVTNLQTTLDAKIPLTQKGAANGVATLDAAGFIPSSQLGAWIRGGIRLSGTLNNSTNNSMYIIMYGITQGWAYGGSAGVSSSEPEEEIGRGWVASEDMTLIAGSTLSGHAFTIKAPGDEGDNTVPIDLEAGDMLLLTGYSYPSSVHTWEFTIINNSDARFANYLPLSGGTMTGTLTNARTNTNPALDITGHAGASNYNFILRGFNDTGAKAIHFVNGSTRTGDGGANTYTIRNDGGNLRLGNSGTSTILEGNIGIGTSSPGQKLHVVGDAEIDGSIYINDTNTRLHEGTLDSLRVQTSTGYVDIGSMNGAWLHIQTDRPRFYFDKPVSINGNLQDYSTGSTYWHAGNDGSGSGLDADLIDGIDGPRLLYGDNSSGVTAVNATQNVYDLGQYKAGFWDVSGANWTPNTGWWWGATFAHRSNSPSYNYAGQLAFSNGAGGGGLWARTIGGGTPTGWSKLWSSGNHGSGSGLDADLLDNKHASDFLLATARGAANGVAPLNSSGQVPLTNLPSFITGASKGFNLIATIGGSVTLNSLVTTLQNLSTSSGEDYPNFYGSLWVASSSVTLTWTDQTTFGPNYTYHLLSPGDEGDTTSPVTLEAGDMVVFTKYTDAGGDGNDFEFTFSIINNSDPRFANYLPLSGGTMTNNILFANNSDLGIKNAAGTALFYLDDSYGNTFIKSDNGVYFQSNNFYYRNQSIDYKFFINGDSGNVGIGTTTPSRKLQVGSYTVAGLPAPDAGADIVSTGGIIVAPGTYISYDGSYSIHAQQRYNSSGVSEATFEHQGYYGHNFQTRDRTSRMVIKGDTGNVGIGTTSPAQALHIIGAERIEHPADKTLEFVRTGANTFTIEHDTSKIYFYNATTATGVFTMLNNGNVGIGVASPGRKLDVQGGIYTRGSEYNRFDTWTDLPAHAGFYSSVHNGAHFYPNSGSYGAWRVAGSRNGYNGIEFDGSAGNVSLMVQTGSNTTGFHNNSYGWQFYWESGSLNVAKNAYGGGTIATVLDSSNVGTYAFPKGGNWLGDLGSNGFTREHGMSMTGGSEFVVLSKSGQGYTLVDGSYFSYEGGGFFTSSTSAYGDLTGFKSTAANTVNFTQFDGGSAVVQVNGNTVWHAGNDGSGTGLDADLLDGLDSTYFDHRRYTDSGNYLGGYYVGGGSEKPNNTVFGPGKFKVAMLSGSNLGFGGSWNDVMWISTYSGGDVKSSHALVFDKYSSNVFVSDQNFDSASWGTGYKLWHSGNLSFTLSGTTLTISVD